MGTYENDKYVVENCQNCGIKLNVCTYVVEKIKYHSSINEIAHHCCRVASNSKLRNRGYLNDTSVVLNITSKMCKIDDKYILFDRSFLLNVPFTFQTYRILTFSPKQHSQPLPNLRSSPRTESGFLRIQAEGKNIIYPNFFVHFCRMLTINNSIIVIIMIRK